MMPLAGYADRLSVRPGETIAFKVANATGATTAARVVRVVSADPNPAGPGIILEPVAVAVDAQAPASSQTVQRGSYARSAAPAIADLRSFTLLANVLPTRPGTGEQAIISAFDTANHRGAGLGFDGEGRLMASFASASGCGGTAGFARLAAAAPLPLRTWCRVWLSYDAPAGTMTVGFRRLEAGRAAGAAVTVSEHVRMHEPLGAGVVLIAGSRAGHDPFRFDGRIERPMIFERALAGDEIETAARGGTVNGLVACWDFAKDMHTSRIVDIGPHGLHGELFNAPARAMRGSNWTGREQCFRHAPAEYGAIHFHADDLDDCRWPTTHTWTVPAGTRSGVYALMLEAGGHAENIPFHVVPPKGKPAAKVALLMSTFTYTVYHNHARPEWQHDPAWKRAWLDQAAAWGGYRHNPGDHMEYGLSTYNYHGDGSGIHFASWYRPMLNVRIGYITYPDPAIRGSGLRHFPADTHLIAWLEAKGIAYDIITDWELHHEGLDLLKPYRVVMTGSHPEYHTAEMLDALEAYRDQGGRFMYMGGNGFYWKIALNPEKPGQIEIRRAEGGIRAWAAEPGEYYNQLDGEYGGLWRRNARPPQKLCGVGFTAQGNFIGSYYRVKAEARRDPRVAWILEGVAGEKVGDFGLSGNGAAGFELDRADVRLGTPAHAIVVAASENHSPEAPWVLVPEEQLTHHVTLSGEPPKQLIRADMTFFETPNNGAVFATGSITYCGSLPVNGFDNSISRITENVLRRFLDPAAKFPLPATSGAGS